MAEQRNQPETGIQKLPNPMLTGIQAAQAPLPPPQKSPPPSVEQNRELVWIVLGMIVGAISGVLANLYWEGNLNGVILGGGSTINVFLRAIIGGVLGFAGGFAGEYLRAGKFNKYRLLPFWTV